MTKPNILVQLDTDAQPSVFDAVVAVDADVATLLQYGGITPDAVQSLVYGAIFTRGVSDLRHTAIFVGGSDVHAGERVLERVQKTFFGPMRVSVMMDSNGANTTAAAAVLAARAHVELEGATAVVLGATGPVGQRAVRLLAAAGAQVRVASRSVERAVEVCRQVRERLPDAKLIPCATEQPADLAAAIRDTKIVIAAGALGVTLLPAQAWQDCPSLVTMIDLNAVPPLGIEGVELQDRGTTRGHVLSYGALGVGGLKMKIHKAALRRLFESNDAVLDVDEIFKLGCDLNLLAAK